MILVQVEEFGVREQRELKPDGHNIAVTDENKEEYVKLVCQMKMTGQLVDFVFCIKKVFGEFSTFLSDGSLVACGLWTLELNNRLIFSGSIRKQLDAFLSGFYEIIPKTLISMFNEQVLLIVDYRGLILRSGFGFAGAEW